MTVNLWSETEAVLRSRGITLAAVKYVLNKEGFVPISEFVSVASGYAYDNEKESLSVDPTLKVVGHGWWLERRKIGKKEGWVFRKRPLCPTIQSPVFRPDMNRTDEGDMPFDRLEDPE